MEDKLDQGMIMQTLDYCYEKAVNGLPGFGTAEELAQSYINDDANTNTKDDDTHTKDYDILLEQANSLIRWQITKAAASGFVTGLGGILTLSVAIPANIGSVLYIQIRMIAAIAYLGGYDLHNDKVRTLVYACVCGSSALDIIKEVGIQLGKKLGISAIRKISGATITKINQRVGFCLLTKFGQTGIINLGKLVPVIGGLIGGTIDGVSTNTIANIAVKAFIENQRDEEIT